MNSGSLVIDGSGKPILCDHCPCLGGSCADLSKAILKRQKAYGLAAGSWIDPNDDTYSIAQYRSYINGIAPKFVDGLYGGGVNMPTMLTSSYANAGNNCAELYALVVDLVTTREAAWYASIHGYDYRGENPYPYNGTCSEAKANAEANYSLDSSTNFHMGCYITITKINDTRHGAFMRLYSASRKLQNDLPNGAALEKSGRLFVYPDYGSVTVPYFPPTAGWPEAQEWFVADASPSGFWVNVNSDLFPSSVSSPGTWVPCPTLAGYENRKTLQITVHGGGPTFADCFWLVDWRF